MPLETSNSIAGGATDGIEQDDWRTSLAPALLGGGLAAFLALVAALMLIKRKRAPQCLQRSCSMQQVCQPHPQLYTTEPGKRNGKTLSPPDGKLNLPFCSSYVSAAFNKQRLTSYAIITQC